MRALFIMACLFATTLAASFEKRDLRGLAVTVETIPEEVIVDGLAVSISRAESTIACD